MDNIINFLDLYYDKAIQLSENFKKTRKCSWNSLIILNELGVQIGQIYNILYQTDMVNEGTRRFNNLGDELSDVVLQLIALADYLDIDLREISKYDFVREINFMSMPILFGQLNESIMEKYEYRFSKAREGFSSIEEFIQDKIYRLLYVTFQIASFHGLNMEKEFSEMLVDAHNFLLNF